jgi:hypothetical protein
MRSLGLLFSLLSLPSLFLAQGEVIHLQVVRQERFINRGHHPENNRRVILRLTNTGNRTVNVYGAKYDGEFFPIGYLIQFENGIWQYPTGAVNDPGLSGFPKAQKETYSLQHGKSLTFTAEMSELEVGRKFKRTVYISDKEGDAPRELRSKTFVLK